MASRVLRCGFEPLWCVVLAFGTWEGDVTARACHSVLAEVAAARRGEWAFVHIMTVGVGCACAVFESRERTLCVLAARGLCWYVR